MALLKSFSHESLLSHVLGPLSEAVSPEGIKAANKEVKEVLQSTREFRELNGGSKNRGPYERFTAEEKVQIGKRAAEHGVTATVRYCSRKYHGHMVKDSSVQMWRNKYLEELKRKKSGKEMVVKELPNRENGRPLLLGEELDQQVQAYLLEYRRNATVVNTAIVIGCAQGLVKDHDSNLLEANGGPIALTKSWAKYLLSRMGFVKRHASTKGKKLHVATGFHELKAQFLFDIKAMMEMEEIPEDLVINWDQTGIHYVPVSSYTMEKEGAKRVELVGIDDKRQITAVLAGT